jgi:hypothetical protein
MDHGQCLAMVWAFLKTYQIGSARAACLEILDWYCLPEFRGTGLGIQAIKALMSRSEPILAVGGSGDTRSLLPRLKWKVIGHTTHYVLPLEGRALGAYVRDRWGIPIGMVQTLFHVGARWWFHRGPRVEAIKGGRVEKSETPAPELSGLYSSQAALTLIPRLDPIFVEWLMKSPPEMGCYILLNFRIEEKLSGWSLSRLYDTPAGRQATIIELFAPHPDPALYAWMIAETLLALAPFRPDTLHAAASEGALQEALKRRHFLGYHKVPISVWPKEAGIPNPPYHIGHNTADGPLLPYAGLSESARLR